MKPTEFVLSLLGKFTTGHISKITIRFVSLFLAMAIIVAATGGFGMYELDSVAKSVSHTFKQRFAQAKIVSMLKLTVQECRVHAMEAALVESDPDEVDLYLADYETKRSRFTSYIKILMDGNEQLDVPPAVPGSDLSYRLEVVKSSWIVFEKIANSIFDDQKKLTQKIVDLKITGDERRNAHTALTSKINRDLYGSIEKINTSIDDLLVVVNASIAEAGEKVAKIQKQANLTLLGVIAAAIIFAIFLGVISAKKIVKNLYVVMDRLKDIATGEGDLTKRIESMGDDEFGQLADSFNTFVGKIHDIISQVTQSADNVSQAAEILLLTSAEVAEGSAKVVDRTTMIATASEEMAATSNDISMNCASASSLAEQADDATTKGAEVFRETISSIVSIADRAKSTAETIRALGERSQDIGKVVGTVQQIAGRVNLLALNAAIEAERAGEYRRGFSVIADEIRLLSKQTSAAAKEINGLVHQLKADTETTVKKVQDEVEEVVVESKKAATSDHAINEIFSNIKQLTSRVNEIAAAAEEQSATTSGINQSLAQIDQEVRASSEASKHSADSANHLTQLSGELQQIVGKFKLSSTYSVAEQSSST